ncbi:MAG TPA: hypothetical protein ENI82_03305 [Bacteroidetes bacterium]|nr:hypothetical protein [Bacteroidota bacterium]
MRKKIKNTITFISLFIALVIFSHSILPHDHHFLLVGTHDNNDDGSEKKSAHCFYFNDVIIQKSSLSSNIAIKKLVKVKVFAIKNILVQEALFAPNNYSDDSFYYPVNEIFSYTSPTRGSPFNLV